MAALALAVILFFRAAVVEHPPRGTSILGWIYLLLAFKAASFSLQGVPSHLQTTWQAGLLIFGGLLMLWIIAPVRGQAAEAAKLFEEKVRSQREQEARQAGRDDAVVALQEQAVFYRRAVRCTTGAWWEAVGSLIVFVILGLHPRLAMALSLVASFLLSTAAGMMVSKFSQEERLG